MIDVALASCLTLPEPDPDEAPLLKALRDRGLVAETWAWDDADVDWSETRMVLLRSTWNYYEDLDAFLAWAARVDEATTLHNPVEVLIWNTHKRYLLELCKLDVPVVPTELVVRGDTTQLAELCTARGWRDIVVKPAVAAASFGAYMTNADDIDQGRFAALVAERDTLVQPFVESVRSHGERSVVVIDGQITHSVRKEPRFGDDDESVSGPHPIAPDDAKLVHDAIAAIPGEGTLLYTRVDIVRDTDGAPMVSELELAEPSLFFPYSDEALARMVTGVERTLAQGLRQ